MATQAIETRRIGCPPSGADWSNYGSYRVRLVLAWNIHSVLKPDPRLPRLVYAGRDEFGRSTGPGDLLVLPVWWAFGRDSGGSL